MSALENSAAELQGRIEELLRQIEALSDAARMADRILAGREQDLATARSATATLEGELRSLTSTAAAHVARIAELESVTINVGHALQAQTTTAESALAAAEASSKQVRAQQTKLADLEAALSALSGAAGERTRAAETATNPRSPSSRPSLPWRVSGWRRSSRHLARRRPGSMSSSANLPGH